MAVPSPRFSIATGRQQRVTVSIVIHGQWALARTLLDDLDRHCHSWIDCVVLTVNQPEQVTPEPAWRFPLELVHNPQPKGFGANHNAAFKHCKGAWFLVLNPDIRLQADVIACLLDASATNSGLLAPRIREPGKPHPEPHRHLPTPWELLKRRMRGHRPPPEPAWVPGMFMLLRAEAFGALAGFDERYYMYCEDVDLCVRLRLAGWTIQVVETAMAEHAAQRASHAAVRPLLWHVGSLGRLWLTWSFWRARTVLLG